MTLNTFAKHQPPKSLASAFLFRSLEGGWTLPSSAGIPVGCRMKIGDDFLQFSLSPSDFLIWVAFEMNGLPFYDPFSSQFHQFPWAKTAWERKRRTAQPGPDRAQSTTSSWEKFIPKTEIGLPRLDMLDVMGITASTIQNPWPNDLWCGQGPWMSLIYPI